MKTRREMATYITARKRAVATPFERHGWQLVDMWNQTRKPEVFLAMLMKYWLDACVELAEPPDEFYESYQRNEFIGRTLLTWLGIDLESIVEQQGMLYYEYTSLKEDA
jgi:hypothetical protein